MPEPVVPKPVQESVKGLARARPMRRGSLSERFMKCGKAGCPCARDPKARHGPYYSVTRGVGGQTRSRLVPPEQVEVVRSQIQAGHEFRKHVDAFWQACEEWADAELEPPKAASEDEAAKKGASKGRSPRRSSPRSKG